MLDYLCSVLVRFCNRIFHLLPIRFTLWFGRQCGILAFHVNMNRRVIGYANLRAAFCGEKTPGELRRTLKNVYRNLVETVFEILSLTKVDKRYIDTYVDIVNQDHMMSIAGYPRGIIFLTAHFGNWELSGVVSALKGFPLVVLAREQKMKRMNELINGLRESKGLQVVRKGITTKYILKALHQGKIIGMVGDQDAGKAGVFVDFFGRPASTASGTARFARTTGAYILPVFMARIKGPRHRLILEKPIRLEKGQDVTPFLRQYSKLLEGHVRTYPEQWLWLHKRWKSTPIRKVVILHDGKTGHLNQSIGVSKKLKAYRQDSGYAPGETLVETVEVRFRNSFTRAFLSVAGLFASNRCQGCMRCLKLCLTRESYGDLMKRHCDVVISCGSGLASVNRFFSIENNAKSAVVMKPSLLPYRRFHMVVLPWHDATGNEGDNVIVADTVPNPVDQEYLAELRKKDDSPGRAKKPVRIGVLLGGDNADFALTDEMADELLSHVIDASHKLDADILFSTSRRTPGGAERIVKQRLSAEKRCKYLVIANEHNTPHAVGKILSQSTVVIVSGESASMISEAISSGTTVVVFRLKKQRKNSKFEKMLDHLTDKGYIVVTGLGELSDTICRRSREKEAPKVPGERDAVYMHMWRLL